MQTIKFVEQLLHFGLWLNAMVPKIRVYFFSRPGFIQTRQNIAVLVPKQGLGFIINPVSERNMSLCSFLAILPVTMGTLNLEIRLASHHESFRQIPFPTKDHSHTTYL